MPLCAKRKRKGPPSDNQGLYIAKHDSPHALSPREWHPFPLFPFASRAEPISIAPLLSADASKSRPNTILVLCMCLYFWHHSVAQSLSHILITVMCMQLLTCFVRVHVFARVHPTMSCIPLVLVLTLAKSTMYKLMVLLSPLPVVWYGMETTFSLDRNLVNSTFGMPPHSEKWQDLRLILVWLFITPCDMLMWLVEYVNPL